VQPLPGPHHGVEVLISVEKLQDLPPRRIQLLLCCQAAGVAAVGVAECVVLKELVGCCDVTPRVQARSCEVEIVVELRAKSVAYFLLPVLVQPAFVAVVMPITSQER